MKKLFLLFFVISSSIILKAQNDLVVFSEQGERFYVIIDGVKQNAKPETNVKVTGLKQPMVTAKIIFDGGQIPDIDKKIYFMWAGEQKNGWEFSCAIVKKGDAYQLKQRSGAEIVQAAPPAGQTVVVYSTTPPVTESTTTIYSTTTTTEAVPAGNNVNIGMNPNGVNFNVNMNVNNPNMNATTTTSTMTSTTTTSSSNYSSNGEMHEGHEGHHDHDDDDYVLEGYNGSHNCRRPMNPGDFVSAKNSIKSKSFEDSKLTIAKQILGSNCMLSSQIKEVMTLFDFENTKLDFAKFAWGKTFDPGNYFKLNDAFQFESSIDELNKYIDSQK